MIKNLSRELREDFFGVIVVLIFLFSFLGLASAEGLQKVRIDDFSVGQNSNDLADKIPANSGVTYQNVVTSKIGELRKRQGQAIYADDNSNTAFTGVGAFYQDVNTSYMLAASGQTVVKSTPTGASWTTVNGLNLLTSGKDTEFVQANDLVFVLNGSNNTANWNGSLWDAGTSSSASPPKATTGSWLRNYLFLAGNTSHLDWVYFSNNLLPKTFDASDLFKVNTGDGQKIIRIEAFKLNELIIYKERSIYDLDITGTTPLTDWTLQPITRSIGCIAPRSVVNIGNDHWFLSSEPIAVRSLSRTSYDKLTIDMVSKSVQDIFNGTADESINTTYANKSCAVLFDDKYLLAIPTGVSTVNNLVLSFDFITKSWSQITGWYPAAWIVYEKKLYYADANDGRVLQCFAGTTGDFTAGPVKTSASEPLEPISFTWTSKNIDFDVPENYKQLDALDVEFYPSGDYTSTLYIEIDNGGFQSVGTINLKGGGVTLPENLPFTLSASGVVRKTFQLQRYGEFKKIKVKVVQEGLSEGCELHSMTLFASVKNWRRE